MTSTARRWHLLADDGKAEDHVLPLSMCFTALLRNALENLVLLAWPGAACGGTTAAVVLFGLHLLDQQQRAAFLVLRPPAQASST